ncbi:MAG: ribbon-helix-helix domain-containing protein [Campylobacterales bacterium]|nr:ribbon-helix-helix domain-containing protein [Campylobacterales bacterium]
MIGLEKLEKQQVGLRLPKYLIDDIDDFTKEYSLNRSEIITEAIKEFISNQKAEIFYRKLDKSAKETKDLIDGKTPERSLKDLVDEL